MERLRRLSFVRPIHLLSKKAALGLDCLMLISKANSTSARTEDLFSNIYLLGLSVTKHAVVSQCDFFITYSVKWSCLPLSLNQLWFLWHVARKLSQPTTVTWSPLISCKSVPQKHPCMSCIFTFTFARTERTSAEELLSDVAALWMWGWGWLGTCTRSAVIINLSLRANKLGTLWSERSSSSNWALSSCGRVGGGTCTRMDCSQYCLHSIYPATDCLSLWRDLKNHLNTSPNCTITPMGMVKGLPEEIC